MAYFYMLCLYWNLSGMSASLAFFFLMVLWGLGEEGKWAVIWDCPPAGSMCWHAWLLERSQATDPVLKTEKSFRF